MLNEEEKKELKLLKKEFNKNLLDYLRGGNNYIKYVMKLHKKYNLKKIKNRKGVNKK